MLITIAAPGRFVPVTNTCLSRRRLITSQSINIALRRRKSFSTTRPVGDRESRNGESARLRRCLVTGGTSGIGYAIAKQLVLHGASAVTITSRKAEKASKAIDQLMQETNHQHTTLDFLEYDPNASNGFFDKWGTASSTPGPRFDTLINCAGVSQTQGLLSTSSSTIEEILKVNLTAPIELSRRLLKEYFLHGKRLTKLSAQEQSPTTSFCVVNISSLLADRGGYGTSVYSSSKAGLTAFTRTLVLEGAAIRDKFPALPVFRANVVLPGYIDTPMIENFSSAHKQKLTSSIPLRRYGTADEVADAVMFVLKNEYANNTALNLDGGLSAT